MPVLIWCIALSCIHHYLLFTIKTGSFWTKIGLKSSFVVAKFPHKGRSKRLTNLSNLEYMPARFEYKPLFASI